MDAQTQGMDAALFDVPQTGPLPPPEWTWGPEDELWCECGRTVRDGDGLFGPAIGWWHLERLAEGPMLVPVKQGPCPECGRALPERGQEWPEAMHYTPAERGPGGESNG